MIDRSPAPLLRRRSVNSLRAPRFGLSLALVISMTSLAAPRSFAVTSICLSEFVAANATGLEDEDDETPDWIELVNAGTVAMSLAGWGLTDDPDEPQKWLFPDRTLDPGERLVVFASGKDRVPLAGELHTNFKLSSDGDFLALTQSGFLVDTVSAPEQRADVAYGRNAAGEWRHLIPPTPGVPNLGVDEYLGIVPAPDASIPRGWFTVPEPFEVALSVSAPGATIHFSLDGRTPSSTVGAAYTTPVLILPPADRSGVVLRAIATRPDYLPSRVTTHSYLFVDGLFAQSDLPAGFPDQWGSHPAVDYAVDPEVSGDPTYTARLLASLSDIPTVSISLDPEEFFGAGGIYANPTGTGMSWERRCSVEILPPDGRPPLQVDSGLRIYGGASRNPNNTPKHSMRLIFRSLYGENELCYPLFPDSTELCINSVVLRGGYNYTWHHGNGGQRDRALYLRDEFLRRSQRELGRVASHGAFVHLFIDGLYWGLYNPTERPDAEFAARYLGGDGYEYDALNSGSVIDGGSGAWNELLDRVDAGVTTDAEFASIAELLDVESFIDYMLLNFWGGNTDWPGHNWYAARRRVPEGRFHFFSWDAEHTFKSIGQDVTGIDSGAPGNIYDALRGHPEFRRLFGDRAHAWLGETSPLGPDAAEARFASLAGEIDRAIIGESARWGDYRRDVDQTTSQLYRRDTHWLEERENIVENYLPVRASLLIDQLRNRDLYPALDAPVVDLPPGRVAAGSMLTLSAPGGIGSIYYTLDGDDPRDPATGDIAAGALEYTAPIALPAVTELRARALLASEWSAVTRASYWHPEPGLALRVTEIQYHPSDSTHPAFLDEDLFEFLRLTNVGASTIDLTQCRFVEGITFDFVTSPIPVLLPGESIYVAGHEGAFVTRYGSDLPLAGAFSGRLSNGGETLRLETTTGALIQSFTYSDDWYPATDGWGYSLVVRDPTALRSAWDSIEQWRSSARAITETSGPIRGAGHRLPGDFNSDGQFDVADVGAYLGFLFGSEPPSLPCSSWSASVNALDLNGDLTIDISDVLYALAHLFTSGAPPVGGTECSPIAGCDSACAGP